MLDVISSRRVSLFRDFSHGAALVAYLCALVPCVAIGQVHGIPPSVTSIQFHVPPFLPNIRPSVTSVGPYPAYNPSSIPRAYGIPQNLCAWGCRHRGSYAYNAGAYYGSPYVAVPYYVSADSGPYLYSGPPTEQTVHIVVDLPSTRQVAPSGDDEEEPPRTAAPQQVDEAESVAATVLVFRDGHQQEVSNYAIMGQTLYVLDTRTHKIALGDLDLPATIKLNDDRGVEFHLPTSHPS